MLDKYFSESKTVLCIGAMDGASFDEFHPYIQKYGQQFTKGVFVEHIPWWFKELTNTYRDYPNFEFENSALTPEDRMYPMTTIPPEKSDGLFEFWWMKGASVIGEVFTNMRRDVNPHHPTNERLAPHQEVIQVNGMTFKTLVEKYKLTNIDLIQIDTEGYDWKVLKQIDLKLHNPKMILVEIIHLTESERVEMKEHLTNHGYEVSVLSTNTDNWLATKKQENLTVTSPNMKTLSEIAKIYPTDKDFTHNYYNLVYEDVLSPIRNEVKKVCEIGIGLEFNADLNWRTGHSLMVWEEYFPNAAILGLDIVVPEVREKGRITMDWMDQSKLDIVKEYASRLLDYDLIVDDGSHNTRDQQITLVYFLKALKTGGIYILEDLHTSVEVDIPAKNSIWNWGEPGKTTPLALLNHFKDTGEVVSDYLTTEECQYLKEHLGEIKITKIKDDSITSVIVKK